MKKENWIAKVESSSEGLNKIEPADSLWEKIQAEINTVREIKFTPKQVFAIAASIALLISLNFSLMASSKKTTQESEISVLQEQLGENSSENIYGEL